MEQQLLIMISGLPGTGKTTFALALAKHLDISHFNSDMLRAEIGMRGRYDEAAKKTVYTNLLKQVKETLNAGKSAIVDATFYKEYLRSPFKELGDAFGVPLVWIELKASEANIKNRIGKERPYSEADFGVYLNIKKTYEPLGIGHLSLWTDQLTIPQMIKETEEHLSLYTKPTTNENN